MSVLHNATGAGAFVQEVVMSQEETGSEPNPPSPSRARDHLANERTYLAWLRAAATVMVLGLAIAQFVKDRGVHAVLAGALLVIVGVVGLLYGTRRYRRVNQEIEQGFYVTGSRGRGPTVASAVLIVAVVAAFVLLVLG